MNCFFNESIIRHDFLTGKGRWYTIYRTTPLLEVGYVYSPYIPILKEPHLVDPNNYQPREGIMSRYATRVVNNNFYGNISVNNIPFTGG